MHYQWSVFQAVTADSPSVFKFRSCCCSQTWRVRRGREYPRCSDWLFGSVNRLTTFLFAVRESVCPAGWESVVLFCPVRSLGILPFCRPGCLRAAACCKECSLRCAASSRGYPPGFTCKNDKMTHFNKGPAYGLSAEVRSKVSVRVMPVAVCLWGPASFTHG